ncbi:MAG: hypothetical protein AAGI30_02570 [Planctomycetota bacterium]
MSAIASAGSSQLTQILQQFQSQPRSGGASFPQPSAENKAQFQAALEDAGFDTSQLAGLRGELETAVQSALESYDGTGDPRAAIESSITGVLEEAGIDPAELKSSLSSAFESLGLPDPSQFAGAFGAGGGGGVGGISVGGSDPNELINTLLESLGESEDEEAQGQSAGSDLLGYLQNLPPGSLFNRTA